MDGSIEILYADEYILAVNKPSGIPVIPDGYDPARLNLHELISVKYSKVWTVHRLDADTTGVLIFARDIHSHRELNRQFEDHSIQKIYQLIVWGVVSWEKATADFPLRVNGDRQHRTIIDPAKGKYAMTDFRVVQRFHASIIWLTAQPATGYTHQIRAHASSLGLWLIDDPLYFPHPHPLPEDWQPLHRKDLYAKVEHLPIHRTALHAASISFIHPHTLQTMTIEAPLAEDFQAAIDQLQTQYKDAAG